MKLITDSAKQTIVLGRRLGRHLKPGNVVALIGELGTGKTTFTKGVAEGLQVRDPQHVNSPSFVLIREYSGRLPLYHFDFYRIDTIHVQDVAWFEEYFFGNGVSVIEWAEKIKNILPPDYLEISFSFKDESKREIRLKSHGVQCAEVLRRL